MKARSFHNYLFPTLVLFIFLGLASIEYAMGRLPICKCNYVTFWAASTQSHENSQMISDWYTFSHIIHGFIFYWMLSVFAKKLPMKVRFLIALLIEVAWEIVENSSFIIDRYRESTISLDYYGDSILNSVMDTIFMGLGFWLAMKLPTKVTIALAILMEVVVGYIIRDNLTLNVIMLLYPFPQILEWQQG